MRRSALVLFALGVVAACDNAPRVPEQSTRGGPGTPAEPSSNAAAEMENSVDTSPVSQIAGESHASYVQAVTWNDLFEIESGRLAARRSKSPEVRGFAQQMIGDHLKSSERLKIASEKARLMQAPPQALDPLRLRMTHDLDKASDANFDRVYLSQQEAAHNEALRVQRQYAQGGDRPALKEFAQARIPVIEHHISMLRAVRNKIERQ